MNNVQSVHCYASNIAVLSLVYVMQHPTYEYTSLAQNTRKIARFWCLLKYIGPETVRGIELYANSWIMHRKQRFPDTNV